MTKLIVISNEFDFKNEINQIHALFDAGLELFHLRKPLWNSERQVSFLKNFKTDELKKFSLHQFHETAMQLGINKFHYKETDRLTNPDAIAKSKGIKSTSFHDINTMEKEINNFDYCFISPVFKSISKINHTSIIDSEYKVAKNMKSKVFALGGINESRIPIAFERGFYGVAVLGAIWMGESSPVNNFKKLISLCSN